MQWIECSQQFNFNQLSTNNQRMHFKDKIVRFLQDSAERLKLTYQSTLQAIQTLNLLENYHAPHINKAIGKHYANSRPFSLALLSLCCKLHETKLVQLRQLAKMGHPNYRHFAITDLEEQPEQQQTQQDTNAQTTLTQIEKQITQWQTSIMLWLQWRLAVPLLYDQVLSIAAAWDAFTANLQQFPLRFEAQGFASECYSTNYNFMATHICICLYNFNHLISNTSLSAISNKLRSLSLALFAVLIKKLMREKIKMKQYLLSPKLCVTKQLQIFMGQNYRMCIQDLQKEMREVEETLEKYKEFRQKSRDKKDSKAKEETVVKKKVQYFNRHSEDKENKENKQNKENKENKDNNIAYYINCKKSKSKSKNKRYLDSCQSKSEKYKSQSKSKKDKKQSHRQSKPQIKEIKYIPLTKYNLEAKEPKTCNTKKLVEPKEKLKLARQRGSATKIPTKKKSNSIKSIVSKNISGVRKQKPVEYQVKPANCSRASKRSDKSQINSKLLPQQDFSSKSTYWLRSNTLVRPDKHSTNSSIRMKIR